jgi:hypothetical protein
MANLWLSTKIESNLQEMQSFEFVAFHKAKVPLEKKDF